MSAEIMQAVVLCCDGCERSLGDDGRFRTSMEARAAAFSEGWRFPPKMKKNGQLSSGTGSRNTSDVCPDCLPSWEHKPMYDGLNKHRSQYRAAPVDGP